MPDQSALAVVGVGFGWPVPGASGAAAFPGGTSVGARSGAAPQRKIGSMLGSFSRKASNAIRAPAGLVGSSLQDLLDKTVGLASSATGVPENGPVATGAGPPGSADEINHHAHTSATGTLDTTVNVPENQASSSSLVFNVSTGDGVSVLSDRFSLAR